MSTVIQLGMAVALFVIGFIMIGSGLLIIMAREYHETLKTISSQSTRISSKALADERITPILDGSARLVTSVTQMIRTAVGTGAFLCMLGTLICGISFWMARSVQ